MSTATIDNACNCAPSAVPPASAKPKANKANAAPENSLAGWEKMWLGTRLVLAMFAAGLLACSWAVAIFLPAQDLIREMLAALSAFMVGVPVITRAIQTLGSDDLEGLTDQLVAIALIAAWVAGDLNAAALIPLAMVIGHVLEERSLLGTREAIDALAALGDGSARRLNADHVEEEVTAEALRPGDRIVVLPGERLLVDAVVEEGQAALDTAALTGESLPREVTVGDHCLAGCLNTDGRLILRVEQAVEASALAQVLDMLREAEQSKPPITRVLERHIGLYLPLVVALAVGTFFVSGSMSAMMAVLVASCPCALALSAPATAVAALAAAGRLGILAKGTAFLEQMGDINAVVFDKTGTLTVGDLEVIGVSDATDEAELRRYAATAASGSQHPVSLAVQKAAQIDNDVANLHEQRGLGVEARLSSGETIRIGRATFVAESGATVPSAPEHDGPVVACACDGRWLGWLLLADRARPEAAQALSDLRELGITRQVMVTGDRPTVAAAIAKTVGIEEIQAEALPLDKLSRIEAERAAGYAPLVVGDGINDALALKAGSVGVAMGAGGTDVARASADIVLLTDDLSRLPTMIALGRRCRKTVNVNVVIALAWTLITIALAATGIIGPVTSAIVHNLGTIGVLLNAGTLLSHGSEQTATNDTLPSAALPSEALQTQVHGAAPRLAVS
jgi:heavy metal translocating P-type ATPase